MAKKPVMLMILDGFGIAPESAGNAVAAAKKPNYDRLVANYPHSELQASGMFVGLPDGQMGNSEVGHLNIGAGRIVYQSLTKITSYSYFFNCSIVSLISSITFPMVLEEL